MISHFVLTEVVIVFMALPTLVRNVSNADTAPSFRAIVFSTTQSFKARAAFLTVSQFCHRSTPAAITAAMAIATGPPMAVTMASRPPRIPPEPVIRAINPVA